MPITKTRHRTKVYRDERGGITILPENAMHRSQTAIVYRDGRVAYDYPEEVSPYIRRIVEAIARRIHAEETNHA